MSRLVARGGTPFRWPTAFMWALSWGVGAGLGVGIGAWLTVVGETGAPGVESIDVGFEFVTLPTIVFAAVVAVHLAGQVAWSLVRGARTGQREGGGHAE